MLYSTVPPTGAIKAIQVTPYYIAGGGCCYITGQGITCYDNVLSSTQKLLYNMGCYITVIKGGCYIACTVIYYAACYFKVLYNTPACYIALNIASVT